MWQQMISHFFFLVMLLQGQCILKRGHAFYHNYSTPNVKFERLPHFSHGFCAMISASVLLAGFTHFVFMREQKMHWQLKRHAFIMLCDVFSIVYTMWNSVTLLKWAACVIYINWAAVSGKTAYSFRQIYINGVKVQSTV